MQTLFEMVARVPPYEADSLTALAHALLHCPLVLPAAAFRRRPLIASLVRWLLTATVADRPSARQVLLHPLVRPHAAAFLRGCLRPAAAASDGTGAGGSSAEATDAMVAQAKRLGMVGDVVSPQSPATEALRPATAAPHSPHAHRPTSRTPPAAYARTSSPLRRRWADETAAAAAARRSSDATYIASVARKAMANAMRAVAEAEATTAHTAAQVPAAAAAAAFSAAVRRKPGSCRPSHPHTPQRAAQQPSAVHLSSPYRSPLARRRVCPTPPPPTPPRRRVRRRPSYAAPTACSHRRAACVPRGPAERPVWR